MSTCAVDCIQARYSHPAELTGTWRVTGRRGTEAVLALGPNLPAALVPYALKRVSEGSQAEYELLLSRLQTKPQNLRRFLAACSCELLDGLGESVDITRWNVYYSPNTVTLDWMIQDLFTNSTASVGFDAMTGEEITIEKFLEDCPDLERNGFTKKDIRKLYVVAKKIVKNLPRVISKGTPLRGLYEPAT